MKMIIIALIFIILAILIKYGKMYFLIAGYNTMSAEERAKVDIAGIATLFRNVMFGMAFLIIAGYFAAKYFSYSYVENIFFFGSLLIGLPYLLIQSNSDKYKFLNK